jgi:hypothetical protein
VERWSVTIDSQYRQQCSYNKLTRDDQILIDSLIALVPDFYQLAETARKLNRPAIHSNYVAWAPHIENIDYTVKSFTATNNTTQTLTIAEPFDKQIATKSGISQLPKASGRTREQYRDDFTRLIKNTGILKQSPEAALSRVLLPGGQQSSADGLAGILTELTYQLH